MPLSERAPKEKELQTAKSNISAGNAIAWFLGGFLLSFIGVIIVIIIASKNNRNVGTAAGISVAGMVCWIFLAAIFIYPAIFATSTSSYSSVPSYAPPSAPSYAPPSTPSYTPPSSTCQAYWNRISNTPVMDLGYYTMSYVGIHPNSGGKVCDLKMTPGETFKTIYDCDGITLSVNPTTMDVTCSPRTGDCAYWCEAEIASFRQTVASS